MNKTTYNPEQLKSLEEQISILIENQDQIKKEIRMIFADITHFENLVLKILDNSQPTPRKLEFHH